MNVLFVANFGTGTGYAWSTIERVFGGVGRRVIDGGGRAIVCYASLDAGPPGELVGSGIEVAGFDYGAMLREPRRVPGFLRLLRELEVDVLYLTDRPTWSFLYPLFRLQGIRAIVIHDRTSGIREHRSAVGRVFKVSVHRLPGIAADRFIGVSRYVTERLRTVNGTPAARTVCVYNGIDLAPFADPEPGLLQDLLGVPRERQVVFFSGRAQPYKGIDVLIAAADMLRREGRDVVFAVCGDGSALPRFQEDVRARGLEGFHFLGRRTDVPRLLPSATVSVVPSVWAEAFGLTVVEAMAAGVAVVASRTGGIPELFEDGESGILVEPGEPADLARAIGELLDDPVRREGIARAGREHARARFSIDRTVAEIYDVLAAVGPGPLTSAV